MRRRYRGLLGWIQRAVAGCDYCKDGLLENGVCDTCGRWDAAVWEQQ